MDNQPPSDEPKTRQTAVRSSIRKLRERLVPGVKYTLLISAAVNFAMLVVGCLNVHKCPVNKNIPLFLIATGKLSTKCLQQISISFIVLSQELLDWCPSL
jgi:hypothetical protein